MLWNQVRLGRLLNNRFPCWLCQSVGKETGKKVLFKQKSLMSTLLPGQMADKLRLNHVQWTLFIQHCKKTSPLSFQRFPLHQDNSLHSLGWGQKWPEMISLKCCGRIRFARMKIKTLFGGTLKRNSFLFRTFFAYFHTCRKLIRHTFDAWSFAVKLSG